MSNNHLQLNLDLLTQIRISNYEYMISGQPMIKIDHCSSVSGLISFTSLSLIKEYLNST